MHSSARAVIAATAVVSESALIYLSRTRNMIISLIMLLNLHLKLRAQMELITLLARKIAIADTTHVS